MVISDPALLDAFRRQCLTAIRPKGKYGSLDPHAAYLVFLAWLGQDGVTRDDLIDVVTEITTDPDPLRNCWPKPKPKPAPWGGDQPPEQDKLTEYIVIRPSPGLPPGFLPKRLDGWWITRASVMANTGPLPPHLEAAGPGGQAIATGRFEVRADGALAEIYEVQSHR